jgi:hypothetical protein
MGENMDYYIGVALYTSKDSQMTNITLRIPSDTIMVTSPWLIRQLPLWP